MAVARIAMAVALMLYFTLSLALSAPHAPPSRNAPGRGLPEMDAPLVIKRVFSSPVGEVQFVGNGERRTVFLRTAEGAVCEMQAAEGEAACARFSEIPTGEAANVRCVFLFEKGAAACRHRIYSYELQESDLFRVVKSATRSGIEGETSAN